MTEVIIDGAVPHSNRERAQRLLDYLKALATETHAVPPHEIEQWENDIIAKSDDYEFWREIEDEIIDAIEERLPDDYIVELGLHCPGDVVVCKP